MRSENNDSEKVSRLFRRYAVLIHNVTLSILHSEEDAEDADIHVWEKVMLCLDEIADVDSQETKALLITIAERTAIDMYRRRCKRMETEVSLERYEVETYYSTSDMEMENLETELWMRSLPKQYADVVVMHYIAGISQREIARMLGISEGAVNMRMSRARKMLKERWDHDV